MNQNIDTLMRQIFYAVQFSKTCHKSNIKKLMKYYQQYELPEFWASFVLCFKLPLTIAQHHPRVEHTLQFVAKFAVSLLNVTNEESEESLCPFFSQLFDFLLSHLCAKDQVVRFRICNFLHILLNSMGDQAFLDDNLCDKITVSMMDRLLDKSPKVRVQTIFALYRLQDPMDGQCPIIEMCMYHASRDPKAEVRKAALMCMGKNQKTLQVALSRTRDLNERVRKAAYEFISKVTVRSLTIIQRHQLLNDGLLDRSEKVRKCVENVLLPTWLRHFNEDFIALVKALDAEIDMNASVLALDTLFKKTELNILVEQLPIHKETKLIPLDKLVTENVLYWRRLVKHIYSENHTEELEKIIPELSMFCTYISDFLKLMSAGETETWVNNMQKFILLQLFEIVTTYDLSDELGRKKLSELICNTLISNHWSEKIIECIVSHLQYVVPDVNSRVNILCNVISDIRAPLMEPSQVEQVPQLSKYQQEKINVQIASLKVKLLELKEIEYQAIQDKEFLKADSLQKEISTLTEEIKNFSVKVPPPSLMIVEQEVTEKNDPETMIKCLSIICTLLQSVTSLTPTLRDLMKIGFVSLDHSNDNVHILALKTVSICCILDKEIAKKHIIILLLQFSLEQENSGIWVIALKGIFDLLLLYGLDYFGIVESQEGTAEQSKKSSSKQLYTDSDREVSLLSTQRPDTEGNNCNFIKILTELLDNANEEIRTIATEGFCKLLINQRINSVGLLSRLIILCFNPVNDRDYYLRQCLSTFFDNFLTRVPQAQEMLEGAYLPTLKILYNAPETSPLQEVDPYVVSKFILLMTRHGLCKPLTEDYHAHNSLVYTMLAEILNLHSCIDQQVLVKSLQNLYLDINDDVSKENLRRTITTISEMIQSSGKQFCKYIDIFKRKLDNPTVDTGSQDEDTETDD
ncbi:condensin complex subunit 3-like [Colletes gigas]|uniref:condensin complex subunit 3-like n=1 Tax=Colletes gigas TaxID=935657 RepID=UPI001C9A9768|nr:condensin complex subunit 3-like [Colletes gigas]